MSPNAVRDVSGLYRNRGQLHDAWANFAASANWKTVQPLANAVSTKGRTINPELERFMAKRMGARVIEVEASHVSMISKAGEIAPLFTEAAGHER